jgi:hypothetical protein
MDSLRVSDSQSKDCSAKLLIFLALTGGLISAALQGPVSLLSGNSCFYISTAFRLPDDPNFANDTFIQSLRYFVSVYWKLLGYVLTPENASPILQIVQNDPR